MRIPNITASLASAMLTLGLGACTQDSGFERSVPVGMLYLDIQAQGRVAVAGGNTHIDAPYLPGDAPVRLSMESTDGDHAYAFTWDDASAFPQGQLYFAGQYALTASAGDPWAEGFDTPAWAGYTGCLVTADQITRAALTLEPASAFVTVAYEGASAHATVTAAVQSAGGVSHTFAPGEARWLCLRPSSATVTLTATMADGRTVSWNAGVIDGTKGATLYRLAVAVADEDCADASPAVTLNTPLGNRSWRLTDDFVDGAAPALDASLRPGSTLSLSEGMRPDTPVTVSVCSATPLRSVMLNTSSACLRESGMPIQVDLLHPSSAQGLAMHQLGLEPQLDAAGGIIDLTELLGHLVYLDASTAVSAFTLQATGQDGLCSPPLTFSVATEPVEVTVDTVYPAVVGIDRAKVVVSCAQTLRRENVELQVSANPSDPTAWITVEAAEFESLAPGRYAVWFGVPAGTTPLTARLLYCREVRATVPIPRTQPPFGIEVDPYASHALVRITGADPALVPVITQGLYMYVNGSEVPVYIVDEGEGLLNVSGLAPSTAYEFKATLLPGDADTPYTPAVKVVTEAASQLPNRDFEEREAGVKWKSLPAGGRYSQTIVPIFNWQHSASYDLEVPKGWANTNAKTFCTDASVRNTWYMQPSVWLTRQMAFSQSFGVELVSVAFDPHGQPIPDYTQQSAPYLDYSPIVPDIAYRAAGRLFLGRYSFDPATVSETYEEGIDWATRPSALGGFYAFTPGDAARSDYGLARIEVWGLDSGGSECLLARGEARLTAAASYTAFNVPLAYSRFRIKASKIKVLFASSGHAGSLAHETRTVATVPNPVTASSTGSRLCIDNITLSY